MNYEAVLKLLDVDVLCPNSGTLAELGTIDSIIVGPGMWRFELYSTEGTIFATTAKSS